MCSADDFRQLNRTRAARSYLIVSHATSHVLLRDHYAHRQQAGSAVLDTPPEDEAAKHRVTALGRNMAPSSPI